MHSRRRTHAPALALAALFAMAGCKSDDKKQAEKPPPSTDKGLLERGKDLGNRAKNAAVRVGEKGVDLGKQLLGKGKSWADLSLDETQALGKKIVDEAGANTKAAGSRLNRMLSKIARDPAKQATTADRVGRMIVLMIPLVGPTKRYADARRLYEAGVKENDPSKIGRARREALIAFVEGGLDIGMLGLAGSRIDLVASGADKVLTALKVSRTVGTLAGENLRTFDALLDALLTYDDIRHNIDRALAADL